MRLTGDGHVGRLHPFGTALDLELHLIAFVQRLVGAVADDRVEMYEHVVAARALNESITLGSVEPFDCSFFHGNDPFV